MKKHCAIAFVVVSGLPGCALLDGLGGETPPTHSGAAQPPPVCFEQRPDDEQELICHVPYWIEFWMDSVALTWSQRKSQIQALGEGRNDMLRKVLLSQGRGTPYQDRLRAQNWADQLLPSLPQSLQRLVQLLVYQPSQELLEFESALAILTRLNAAQAKELEQQQQRLAEQQQQIEQLLKIEASMMKTQEGINQ